MWKTSSHRSCGVEKVVRTDGNVYGISCTASVVLPVGDVYDRDIQRPGDLADQDHDERDPEPAGPLRDRPEAFEWVERRAVRSVLADDDADGHGEDDDEQERPQDAAPLHS